MRSASAIPGDSGESAHDGLRLTIPSRVSATSECQGENRPQDAYAARSWMPQTPSSILRGTSVVIAGGGVGAHSAGAVSAGVVGYAGKAVAGPENVKQDLGTQVMDGLQVKGTKTTFTIPAGQDRVTIADVVTTTESWYSDELKLIISSKRTDPAFVTSTKATNLRRVEPARDLFEVPAAITEVVEPRGC